MSRHLWSTSRRPKSKHQHRSGSDPQHLSIFAATMRAVTGRVEQAAPRSAPKGAEVGAGAGAGWDEADCPAPQSNHDVAEPLLPPEETPETSQPGTSQETQAISREIEIIPEETQLIPIKTPRVSPEIPGIPTTTPGISEVTQLISTAIPESFTAIPESFTATPGTFMATSGILTATPGIPEEITVEFPRFTNDNNDPEPAGPALSLLAEGRHSLR